MAEIRLIDAFDLAEEIESTTITVAGKPARWNDAKHVILRVIAEQTDIDPESLRPKGRWVMTVYTTTSKRGRVISNKKYACSECRYSNGRKQSNYCPSCGAKMEG